MKLNHLKAIGLTTFNSKRSDTDRRS